MHRRLGQALLGTALAVALWALVVPQAAALVWIESSGVTYSTDWTSSFNWVLCADSSTTADCTGNGNTLTENGTPTLEATSTVPHGSNYLDIDAGSDYLSCTEGSCTGMDPDNDTSIYWGCWAQINTNGAAGAVNYIIRKDTASEGYYIAFRPSGSSYNLRCATGSAGVATQGGGNSLDTWYHAACTLDSNSDLRMWRNASATSVVDTSPGTYANPSTDFLIPRSDSIPGLKLDDCFFDDRGEATWTQANRAKAAACGIDGKRCVCDAPTNPTKYKPCATNADCGGATGICADSATTQTYCDDAGEKCCMGWLAAASAPTVEDQNLNVACNAAAP